MIPLKFGAVRFELHDGWSKTIFPDGKELHARHDPQPGQSAVAASIGYPSVEEMNRDHDLCHCIFAYLLGLPFSGSLYAAAAGVSPTDQNWREEDAVMKMQAFCKSQGIDLLLLARKITAECDTWEGGC